MRLALQGRGLRISSKSVVFRGSVFWGCMFWCEACLEVRLNHAATDVCTITQFICVNIYIYTCMDVSIARFSLKKTNEMFGVNSWRLLGFLNKLSNMSQLNGLAKDLPAQRYKDVKPKLSKTLPSPRYQDIWAILFKHQPAQQYRTSKLYWPKTASSMVPEYLSYTFQNSASSRNQDIYANFPKISQLNNFRTSELTFHKSASSTVPGYLS